jgi:hypothetical protein
MKKYIKSKDFITEKFYIRKQINKYKKEKGLLVLFIIINLLMLPTTTKNIYKTKKVDVSNKVSIEDKKFKSDEINNVNIWIKSVLNDNVEEVYINKDKGEIVIDSLEGIDRLTSNKRITIRDVNLKNDGKYKLGVSLNE